MKKLISILFLLPILSSAQHEETIKKIYDESLSNGHVYEKLNHLDPEAKMEVRWCIRPIQEV
ncbi:MAG: hypothetical protein RLN88_07235 [Ekhidna sp.]|uniref:hypothetical protein n=1 Tax=Ekhidna sp. TaxID=2608089 RepID=UPI0032EB8FFB